MTVINKKTLIPIGLVLSVLTVGVGLAVERTKALDKIETHEVRINKVESQLDQIAKAQSEVLMSQKEILSAVHRIERKANP